MSGIAGGSKASSLAVYMDHGDVEILDSSDDLVSDSTVYSDGELSQILEEEGLEGLSAVEADYAVAWRENGDILLARDILGARPLFYSDEPFSFASERRALEKEGLEARELHPRQILRYDTETGYIQFEKREFFSLEVEDKELEEAAEEVKERLVEAVERRVDGPVGLLFSGGLDSSVLAATLQKLGKEFTCYSAGIQPGNTDPPRDVEKAEEVAEKMDLELETVPAGISEVEEALPELGERISTTSPVKLGVALPFHLGLQEGEEDVVITGLGAEQLYAGYSRQREDEIGKECLSGLRSLFHRDLYRDNVVSSLHGKELRLPFLDHDLVRHSLTLPGELKVRDGYRKYVLRLVAEKLGVPEEAAWRKKTAAQYGSNFDKAIARLAKDNGFDSKQDYCRSLRDEPEHSLGVLFSGGKDSNAALYRMAIRNNSIDCLINLQPGNEDSYMFDPKEEDLVREQADRLDIPLLVQETEGEKERELEDLEEALERAKEEYGIDGVVAGALRSIYQKERVEQAAEDTGLKAFSPLWNEDQESYMWWLVREGFDVEITEVAARGLEESWEGRILDEESLKELLELAEEHGFHPAGEGGGYETVVVDGPMFRN